MTRHCPICDQPVERSRWFGLCLSCAEVAAEWDLRAIHARIRAAITNGDHDEQRRQHRRMVDRLRVFGETHLPRPR